MIHCECQTWAQMGFGLGKLPMSEHHPNCEHYKLKRYVAVGVDGVFSVMSFEEFGQEAEGLFSDTEEKYEIKFLEMTEDQFEKLEEFQGC